MSNHPRYTPRYPWTAYVWPILFVVGLAALLAWRFWPRSSGPDLNPHAEPRPITPRGNLAEDEHTTIAIFKENAPSVVHITTLTLKHDVFNLDLWQIPKGTGSGFIWDPDGHLVTNFHVIQGADAARVTLADQSSWRAQLVGPTPTRTWPCSRSVPPGIGCGRLPSAARTTCRWARRPSPLATHSDWIGR